MRRVRALARTELILALCLALASIAVLVPQLSGSRGQNRAAMEDGAQEPHMMIDDLRAGDSVKYVEQKLAALGEVHETPENVMLRVYVVAKTPGVHFNAVFKSGKLESAWQSVPVPETARDGNLLYRVLNLDSEEERQKPAANAPN